MTKGSLFRNIFAVSIMLISIAILAYFFKKNEYEAEYSTLKDFYSVFISILAAYMAFCFQKRQSFLVSIRALWVDMVEVKCDLIEYTHKINPSQDDFNKAHRSLSLAIDSVRGVYRNVGETSGRVGLYPFEPLHDMRKILDDLAWGDVDNERRTAARGRIVQAWNALRWAFLKEFSTPEAPHAITERFAEDPRRKAKDNTSRRPPERTDQSS